MALQFVADWPPEAVAREIVPPYRFDPARWNDWMAPVYATFLGYAIAQENGNMPWTYGISMARRRFRTLEAAVQVAAWLGPRELSPSELSCYHNHLAAFERIVASGKDFALVVEDDIVLLERSVPILRRTLQSQPRQWDVVDIVGGVNMAPRGGMPAVNAMFYRVLPPRDRTSCGYLISRRFCIKVLEILREPVLPIDWAMSHAMARTQAVVYWSYPTAFVHGSKAGHYPETVMRNDHDMPQRPPAVRHEDA